MRAAGASGARGVVGVWVAALLFAGALATVGVPAWAAEPAPAAAAGGDEPAAAGGEEEIEEVAEEAVTVKAAPVATAADAEAERGIGPTLGRFHPALVHLPIGWLLMVVLLDLVALRRGYEGFSQAAHFALGGTVLSFVPAIVSGLLREASYEAPADVHEIIETHELVMFVTLGVVVAALALRTWRRHQWSGAPRTVYYGLILAAAGLVAYGGHLGGQAVFGADFLPF